MKTTLGRILVLFLVLHLSLGAPFAEVAMAATLYADVATGDNANNCTAGNACKSISAAIANATAGDTINVAAGIYNTTTGEVFPLNAENLIIQGAGKAVTTIENGGGNAIKFSGVQTATTTFDGFTVNQTGGGWTVWLDGGSGGVVTPTISNNTLTHTANAVVGLSGWASGVMTMSPSITGNTITSGIGSAITMTGSGSGTITVSPTISGNTLGGTSNTIYSYIFVTSGGSVTHNPTITNNTITASGGRGIRITAGGNTSATVSFFPSITYNNITSTSDGVLTTSRAYGGSTTTAGPTVSNNTVTNTGSQGIDFSASATSGGTLTTTSTAQNNVINSTGSDGIQSWMGSYTGATLTHNAVLSNNTISSASNGVNLSAYAYTGAAFNLNPSITNSNITASNHGVYFWMYSQDPGSQTNLMPSAVVSGNTIASTFKGVYFSGTATSSGSFNGSGTISGNTVTSPGSDGVYLFVSSTSSASASMSTTISGNTVTGAGDNGIKVYGWFYGVALPTITGNTVTGGSNAGVYLRADSAGTVGGTVTQNDITGNLMGVMMGADYGSMPGNPGGILNTVVSHNNIKNNTNDGVVIFRDINWSLSTGSTAQPVLSGNTITGNGSNAIYIYYSYGTGTLMPSLGAETAASPGLNTIVAMNTTTFFDIDNSGTDAINALNNWFSQPAAINENPGTVTSNALLWNMMVTASSIVSGGAFTITAGPDSAFVDNVGVSDRITVTMGGMSATVGSVSADGKTVTGLAPAGLPASFDVVVTNPGGQVGTITGATPTEPDGPTLLSPANGATGIDPASVTFEWDNLAGATRYELYICTDPLFTGCTTPAGTVTMAAADSGSLYASIGFVMMGIALAGGLSRRQRLALAVLVLVVASMSLMACGGAGGDVIPGATGSSSYTVTGLNSATTYYWKVVAYDAANTPYTSAVYSFTTM